MTARMLWLAVLGQAVEDASLDPETTAVGTCRARLRKMEIAQRRDIARYWLFTHNRDFVDVCLMAGVEPDAVRKWALQTIEETKNLPSRHCRRKRRPVGNKLGITRVRKKRAIKEKLVQQFK